MKGLSSKSHFKSHKVTSFFVPRIKSFQNLLSLYFIRYRRYICLTKNCSGVIVVPLLVVRGFVVKCSLLFGVLIIFKTFWCRVCVKRNIQNECTTVGVVGF